MTLHRNSPDLPLIFRQQTSRASVIGVTLAIALFGGMFLLGFFSKLSYLGPDEWFLGIFGAILLVLDGFLFRFLTRPGIVLTGTCLEVNRFFGVRRIRYADLAGLSAYLEKIHPPLINGTRMPPRIVHRLLAKTRVSKDLLVTLPDFGKNEDLLQALERCSGFPVERLPDVDKGK